MKTTQQYHGCSVDSGLRVTVAQIGARHHYAVPVALERAGMLHELHTDLCANGGMLGVTRAVLPRGLQAGRFKNLLGRVVPEVSSRKIRTYPTFALSRGLKTRGVKSSADQYEHFLRGNRAFGNLVSRRGFGEANAAYAFNAAALEIFEKARRHGLRTILDQVMVPWAYVEEILAEERERWPDWGEKASSSDAWKPLAEREATEWANADVIICGSEFVVRGVEALSGLGHRCRIVPYGFNAESVKVPPFRAEGPLRVLFLGTLELRKGVPYLLEAARNVHTEQVEFRAVGPIRVGEEATGELRRFIDVTGPVPHSAISEQFAWADVLVLPTVAEGSALVCYEAQAHGLPVITTPNCGSVVRDGVDGWIVPIRDSQVLTARLETLARDRSLLQHMSHEARQRALEFTWDRYHRTLPTVIREALNERETGCTPSQ